MTSNQPKDTDSNTLEEIIREIFIRLEDLSHLEPKTWMSISEAAIYLSISQSQLRNLINSGRLPSKKLYPEKSRSKILLNKRQLDVSIMLGRNSMRRRPTRAELKSLEGLI
ncbi:DNA-binding protein [Candidatus Marinimicrobia bacterium MT.SAG.2]|nr:DNA-binding protein [Candidatus Marinimicrobia bacterium MT.SAG.2]